MSEFVAGNVPEEVMPKQPGEWQIVGGDGKQRIVFGCPLRPGEFCNVPIAPEVKQEKKWLWDGDKKAPTIHPSIHCFGCNWHGFIKKGVPVNA